jgi:hypothetical protein
VIAAGNAGLAVLRQGSSAPQRGRSRRAVARVRHGDRANGDRWFNGSKGVVQVRAADWQAAAGGAAAAACVRAVRRAGWLSRLCRHRLRLPSAIADAEGQLWFAGVSGIARLDSTRSAAAAPPQVKIETLVAQGKRYLDLRGR